MTKLLLLLSFFVVYNPWIIKSIPSIDLKLSFPEEPIKEEKLISTNLGEVKNVNYRYADIENLNFLYSLNVLEYTKDINFESDSLKIGLVDDFVIALNENLNGNIVYKSEMIFDGYKGYIFRISYDENHLICKGKVFLQNNHLISAQVFTKVENSLNDDMDLFLNSLKRIK